MDYLGDGVMLSFILLTEADSQTIEKVRQWRNHPDIRNQMLNNHIITENEHLAWIDSLKNNETARVWVAYYGEIPFGVIDLAKIDYQEKTTDWGIYIGEPDYLKKGLAKLMLFSLMNHTFEVLNLKKMATKVLAQNETAQAFYMKMGFQEVAGSDIRVKRVDGEASFIEMVIDKADWLRLNLDIRPEVLP